MSDLLKYILTPSTIILFGLLFALVFTIIFKGKKIAKICLAISCLLYLILGSGPVSFALMKSLEYQYQPLIDDINNDQVEYIVVLAGYAENVHYLPPSSLINETSAYRILEATRIFNTKPELRKIIISGKNEIPTIMKSVFIATGVPSDKIEVETQSWDTSDSATNLDKLLANKAFYLVTSAGHMPRSITAFRKKQLKPIAAPTHFYSKQNIYATAYLPTPEHLHISDMAIIEYLATFRDYLAGYIINP